MPARVSAFVSLMLLCAVVAAPVADAETSGPFPPWFELKDRVTWCRTAALDLLNAVVPAEPSDIESFPVYDTVLGPTQFDKREYCVQFAKLQPSPIGRLTAAFNFRNGRLVATYTRANRVVTVDDNGLRSESVSAGPVVTNGAARRIIAKERVADSKACEAPGHPAPGLGGVCSSG
jgi:hypothetical protein